MEENILTIIITAAFGLMFALYWLREWSIREHVAEKKRLAREEYRLELIRKLQALNVEFLTLAADMDFLIQMQDIEAQKNRYYNVIAGRYVELYKKVLECYYEEENAPDGQASTDREQ